MRVTLPAGATLPTGTTLPNNVTMATEDEVLAQLGQDVTEEMLRGWHRSYGLLRVQLDGVWWYDLQGAIDCELRAATAGPCRPRRGRQARTSHGQLS